MNMVYLFEIQAMTIVALVNVLKKFKINLLSTYTSDVIYIHQLMII